MVRRDRYLDYLRGVASLWVVVVHVFYFKQFVPPNTLGAAVMGPMLFEMPLLFFVSGASLYHSHVRNPAIGPFLWRRLRRLLVPYLLLGIVCGYLYYQRELANGHPLTFEQAKSWLLLRPWPVEPVYVGAYLWFVRVSLVLTVAHVGLVRLFCSDRYRLPTALLLVAGIVALTPVGKPLPEFYAVSLEQMPQYALFYGAFAYLGYYHGAGRLRLRWPRLAIVAAVAFGLLALAIRLGGVSGDMQTDKFPPNLGYGLFGIGWLAIWLLAQPLADLIADRVPAVGASIRFFGEHSYSVYLWHGFAFWAVDYALPFFHVSDRLQGAHYALWILVYSVFALALSAVLAAAVDFVPSAGRLLVGRRTSGPRATAPSA